MKKQLIIWSILLVVFLNGLFLFISKGSYYFHSSYEKTSNFKQEWIAEENKLADALLPQVTVQEIEKTLNVSQEEIEHYRQFYGTLQEQKENITSQYDFEKEEVERRFQGNEATLATEKLKKETMATLKEEYEKRLKEIEQNFKDDTTVENKIKRERAEAVYHHLNKKREQGYATLDRAFHFTMKSLETEEVVQNVSHTFTKEEGANYHHIERFTKQHPFKVKALLVPLSEIDMEPYLVDFAGRQQYTIPSRSYIGSYGLDYTEKQSDIVQRALNYRQEQAGFFLIIGLAVGAFLLLVTKYRLPFQRTTDMEEAFPALRRVPVDIQMFIIIVLAFILRNRILYSDFPYFMSQHWSRIFNVIWSVGWSVAFAIVFVVLVWNVWMRRTEQFRYEKMWTYRLGRAFFDMFENRSVGVQFFILSLGFFLAGFGFFIAWTSTAHMMIYLVLVVLSSPFLYLFLRRAGYLSKIFTATEKMANGELIEKIPVKGKNVVARHADHLNHLQEGVRHSLNEQARSERLKTELITNVSHDLRTPLTAIITYVDLLKSDTITEEERAKYVQVLDQKSERLKVLIEDLFEVSKMASGHAELSYQHVDIVQLVRQAMAERAEEIEQSSCDVRITLPEEPIDVYVDGQKLWRVFDNLTTNALKYSLEGTRIYMTLEDKGNAVKWSVKNVSKYELAQSADRLVERFQRGDESRHTDGSGLGLAIAQSIVDLHGGQMKIDIDGDLFKVHVTIPKR